MIVFIITFLVVGVIACVGCICEKNWIGAVGWLGALMWCLSTWLQLCFRKGEEK